MYWVSLIIVGLLFGYLTKFVAAKEEEVLGGWWLVLICGLIGSWLGDIVLKDWAWVVQGFNVIAGIIGAIVISGVYILLAKKQKQDKSVSQ